MEDLLNLQANSSEEEFFEKFFLSILVVEVLELSSDGDDKSCSAPHAHVRKFLPGGAGTGRDNRLPPRPFLPSINGEKQSGRYFGMRPEWGRIFVNPTCCATASW